MFDSPTGRACKRLFDSNDFPWLLPLPPWSPARDHQVRRIRRAARAAMRREQVAERGWGRVLAAAAVWPALALVKAGLAPRARPLPLRTRLSLLLDAWWLQLAHNVRLADVAEFRLDLPAQRRKVRRFVTDAENKTLLKLLNRHAPSRVIGDKRPFAEFCARHGLPTVPVLTTGEGGNSAPTHLAPWPAGDLFLKPAALWGGQGAYILHFNTVERTWACDGVSPLTPDTIGAFVRARLQDSPWLLQPRLTNSPDWAAFAPADSALATVRVITGRQRPDAPVRILAGFMRFPRHGSTVDNLGAGGLGADFDVATGRLFAARTLAPYAPVHTHHPDTGGAIEGVVIPRWTELAALACRAHAHVAEIATLGWDVSLTPSGPLLIETNPNWGVPLDTALGETPYVECLLQPAVAARFPG